MIVDAKKFLQYPSEKLWTGLQSGAELQLRFYNGEVVECHGKDVQYSRPLWELLLHYPEAPLKKEYLLCCNLRDGNPPKDAHKILLNKIVWDVYDLYLERYPHLQQKPAALITELARLGTLASSTLFNHLVKYTSEYVMGFDLYDFIALSSHHEVREAIRTVPKTQAGVDMVYEAIEGVINNDQSLRLNPIVLAYQVGAVRVAQVAQVCGVRGFLTSQSSAIFPRPIMRSFTSGFRSLEDMGKESRSNSKSLAMAERPLQGAEFFKRRTELGCSIVKNLHPGDCGSIRLLEWKVEKWMLPTMAGKLYAEDEDEYRRLKIFRAGDKHLVGKTIYLRSPLAGCCHPDTFGICSACFGTLSECMVESTNLGRACTIACMVPVTQNVLSTKHYDGSSVIDDISLDEHHAQFLRTVAGQSDYYLKAEVKKRYRKIELCLLPRQVPNISEILSVGDVRSLSSARMSQFKVTNAAENKKKKRKQSQVALLVTDEHGEITEELLEMTFNRRNPTMTYRLMEYIRQHGYSTDDKGNYLVDLSRWDYSHPIFSLPIQHFNMSDHQKAIEECLEEGVPLGEATPAEMLRKFYGIVNSKLKVNLANVEVLFFANMVRSVEKGMYQTPKLDRFDSVFEGEKLSLWPLFDNRSLGQTLSYQDHKGTLTDPRQVVRVNRPDSMMDMGFCPDDYIKKGGLGSQYGW
jgi:hypothetical protein